MTREYFEIDGSEHERGDNCDCNGRGRDSHCQRCGGRVRALSRHLRRLREGVRYVRLAGRHGGTPDHASGGNPMRKALANAITLAGIGGMLYAFWLLVPLPWFILIASFSVYAIGYNLREQQSRLGRERDGERRADAGKSIPSNLN
jgi:hypothetical protein